VRIGIDDTDSPRGGCTTWLLTELVRVAREERLDLLGEPRLVRLNPNVPWKTRGNAALALTVGHGAGTPMVVGELAGAPVVAYRRGRELSAEESERLLDRAWRTVEDGAPRDPGTDPALVAVRGPLAPQLYWSAVRERVRVGETERALRGAGASVRVRSGRRGIIGAAAAIAWPARRRTWELIAYRAPARWGTPRSVSAASVRAAASEHPQLFLCHDPATRRLLVAPHTACPILFGLRSTTAEAALTARGTIVAESVDRWMLFRTNQGTGDHLVPRTAAQLGGYRSGVVSGSVLRPIRRLAGGHVRFELRDRDGDELRCLAFEPTKTLPDIARRLLPRDRLTVWGSGGRAGGLRLEGIRVVRLARAGRRRPPSCPGCARTTRSLGRGRGWRCDRCRRRWPPEAARWSGLPRTLAPGVYHPTPSARRHLAPLAP
jgi:tRNA(Ile2)-agmatinylcytidine synthase